MSKKKRIKKKPVRKSGAHSKPVHIKSPKAYVEKEISDSSLHNKAGRLSMIKKSHSAQTKKAGKKQPKPKKRVERPRRAKKKVLDSVLFETGFALGKVSRFIKKKKK